MTTTEATRDNSFASLTHRERGFLKVNGGKRAAERTMGQRGDVISCFVDFFALKVTALSFKNKIASKAPLPDSV